jgi:outer membrane protein assembly factor BamB
MLILDDGGVPSASLCVDNPQACYTVYAHGDHTLYKIDLMAKTLVTVGPFNAPQISGKEDVITDLAVSPNDVIYVISKTQLYTADPNDGHVTVVGPVTSCGDEAVAMTFGADGTLYAGDYKGQLCKIDLTTNPPTVKPIAKLSGGLALSGDMVAVGDGTIYGTAYRLSDTSGGTMNNNLLIKLDPTSAATTVIGSTGSKNLYGVSYALGQVFGFTHDQSGDVIIIDPATGKGTHYGTFKDPSTGTAISFAGAGVNSMVAPEPVK